MADPEPESGRIAWDDLVERVGFPQDAILFVLEAIQYTPQYHGDEPGDLDQPPRRCSAQELCRAFVLYAKDTYGENYVEVLQEWGICRSEDVGQLVYKLREIGSIESDKGETLADFDGQFNLDQPR